MQQETLKLNKVQFIRLKKLGKTLKEEFKKRNSFQIEIPALFQARLSFVFDPVSTYGKQEELSLFIESRHFNIPETERGLQNRASIFIPLNRSFKNQKIALSGISRMGPGPESWVDSDMKLLKEGPLEKIIGFNSIAQPNNYETMICVVSFYRLG